MVLASGRRGTIISPFTGDQVQTSLTHWEMTAGSMERPGLMVTPVSPAGVAGLGDHPG